MTHPLAPPPLQYSELVFDELDEAGEYQTTQQETANSRTLPSLEIVNLFVGPNNAGKSRFLRALFRSHKLKYRTKPPFAPTIGNALGPLIAFFHELSTNDLNTFAGLSLDVLMPIAQTDTLKEGTNPITELRGILTDALAECGKAQPHASRPNGQIVNDWSFLQARASKLRAMIPQLLEQLLQLPEPWVGAEPQFYIPILRGLRTLGTTPLPLQARTVQDYFPALGDRRVITTGETLYDELKELRLGDKTQRQLAEEYDAFLSEYFFDQAVELIPKLRGERTKLNDVVYLKIGSDGDLPIYSLGDGMQALIILTFWAFTSQQRCLFFMEEPDTHMHPGLQRKFLEVFLQHPRLRRHQVFLTTHSNHFLDMAADYDACSTLLFRRRAETFEIRSVRQRDRQVLSELGVRASSVFLTNATIWVEGISDRLYLREYLRRYLADQQAAPVVREDTHYSFMECGGANVAHFDFETSATDELSSKLRVAGMCSENFLVLDGDNRAKGERVDILIAALGDRCHVLQSKEVEHLLPVDVLRAYVAKVLHLESNSIELETADYEGSTEPLGEILRKQLGVEDFVDGRSIKNKDALLEFAMTQMRESESWFLTEEARRLCEKLVAFVRSANQLPP